jgi:hypothetical protein
MTISRFCGQLIPSVAIASVAFFGGSVGVGAADLPISDPQEQARQLLAPTNEGQPAALSRSLVPSEAAQSVIDPQELARRLLAGPPRSEGNAVAGHSINTMSVARNTSPGDGQALAQRMILGARSAVKTRT